MMGAIPATRTRTAAISNDQSSNDDRDGQDHAIAHRRFRSARSCALRQQISQSQQRQPSNWRKLTRMPPCARHNLHLLTGRIMRASELLPPTATWEGITNGRRLPPCG